ncbi:MAG: serine/threonine-protein phosphatase, partial [Actinomycetia bacterium]|nr:serine/threonine-protein phosphatase [Actinomycetes bacterium]
SMRAFNRIQMFVTLFLLSIDVNTGQFYYTSAAHPTIVYSRREDKCITLGPDFMPVGIEGRQVYTVSENRLEPGDFIVLYTDGITEAVNENMELYGKPRLINLIPTLKDLPADVIKDKIIGDIKNYRGEMAQNDDITLIVIKYS